MSTNTTIKKTHIEPTPRFASKVPPGLGCGANLHSHSTALFEAQASEFVCCRCSTHVLLACAMRSCCVPVADAMDFLKCSAYFEVTFWTRCLLSRFRSFSFVGPQVVAL